MLKNLFKKKGRNPAPRTSNKGGGNKRAALMLLLLLVAGGGYLFMQGGLDLQPVLEMVGLAEPVPATAPAPAPAPRPARRAATTPAASSPAGAMASGQVNGQPFRVDSAEFRDGILTLRQGRAFSPDSEVAVYLFTEKWQIPEGRSFSVKPNDPGTDNPHVQLGWKQAGQEQLTRRFSTSGFTMELVFTKAKDNRLTGNITLDMGNENDSRIKGKFDAELTGFYVLNGKPNLKSDSHETLAYLALSHLLKNDPKKKINDVRYRNARYTTSGASQTGSLDLEYRNGKKKRALKQHFEFSKGANGWQVSKAGDAR